MNKLKRIFCCVLCGLLLSGCTVPTLPLQTREPTTAEPTTAVIETTEAPTEPPAPVELPLPPAFDPTGLYDGEGNLFHIAQLDNNNDFYSDLVAHGDYLAAQRSHYSSTGTEQDMVAEITLVITNLRTKEITAQIDLDGDQCSIGFLADGSVFVGSSFKQSVRIFSTDGTLLEQYDNISNSYQLVADAKNRLWSFSEWTLKCLYNGEITNYQLPPYGLSPAVMEVRDDTVYFTRTCALTELCTYDLTTETVSVCEGVTGFWSKNGRMYNFTSTDIIAPDSSMNIVYYPWSGETYDTQACVGGKYLFAGHSSDAQTISKINLETKELAQASLGADALFTVGTGNGCGLFEVMTEAGAYEVWYWADLLEDWQEQPDAEVFTLDSEQRANLDTARRLSEEYGIYVHGLSLSEGTAISGYIASATDSPEWDTHYLEELETELQKYPEGFFEGLKSDKITTLELLFCGNLQADGEGGISSAGAVTSVNGEIIHITFNIGGGNTLASNLPHELLHAMEASVEETNRTEDYFDEFQTRYFPEWSELNPEGYTYFEDYGAYEEPSSDASYTTYFEEDPENVWFIDLYSKTYAKEDQARVFENLMSEWDTGYFSAYPHLAEKARCLCDWIREYFPDFYQDGTPLWESNYELYS